MTKIRKHLINVFKYNSVIDIDISNKFKACKIWFYLQLVIEKLQSGQNCPKNYIYTKLKISSISLRKKKLH